MTVIASVPDISIVIPCYNEELNAAPIAGAVAQQLRGLDIHDYEIVFIDNHSSDRTVAVIKALCQTDDRIRLIVNNRDYGQMRSPTHAVYQTRGRAVIGLCADFQDPPALIPELIARWRAGADIVLGVRGTERSSLVLRTARAIGYGFFERFADYPIIPNATGFGLYSRPVIDCVSQWNEPEPFWRGMLVESGFRLETIEYVRPPRRAGLSKNNLSRLLDFALSGVAGSSKRLLRYPIYLGIASIAACALLVLAAIVAAVLGRAAGVLAIGALVEFNAAALFLVLGFVGDQIRIVSERTRNVPLVVEAERVNFSPDVA